MILWQPVNVGYLTFYNFPFQQLIFIIFVLFRILIYLNQFLLLSKYLFSLNIVFHSHSNLFSWCASFLSGEAVKLSYKVDKRQFCKIQRSICLTWIDTLALNFLVVIPTTKNKSLQEFVFILTSSLTFKEPIIGLIIIARRITTSTACLFSQLCWSTLSMKDQILSS